MRNNKIVIERIKSAVGAGVKIAVIAEKTGITYFRMASTVNSSAYRQCTKFTDSEVKIIHKALDSIKEAI